MEHGTRGRFRVPAISRACSRWQRPTSIIEHLSFPALHKRPAVVRFQAATAGHLCSFFKIIYNAPIRRKEHSHEPFNYLPRRALLPSLQRRRAVWDIEPSPVPFKDAPEGFYILRERLFHLNRVLCCFLSLLYSIISPLFPDNR